MEQTLIAIYENGVLRPVSLVLGLQEGQRLEVTVRPQIELDPAEQARREAEFEQHMKDKGLLETEPVPLLEGVPYPENFQPLVLEGEPMSETIIKMRRGE